MKLCIGIKVFICYCCLFHSVEIAYDVVLGISSPSLRAKIFSYFSRVAKESISVSFIEDQA